MQRYRNWGLMIIGVYLTPVLWLSLLIAIFFGACSFICTPIYEATTILSLDSSLSKILKNLKTSIPATESGSFIRVEYFATNTLETISYPEISEVVINELNITDKNGELITPSDLLSNGTWGLSLFSHSKKAINIEWVADTQQFSITGYATDVKGAATLASSYANAFLKNNSDEFSYLFDSVLTRLEQNKSEREEDLKEINQKIIDIQRKNIAYDIDNSIDALTLIIQSLESDIDDLDYAEATYQIKFNHLSSQIDDLEKLKTFEKKLQKNPEVSALLASVRTLLVELTEISTTKTVNHPSYKITQEKIKKTQELLKKEAETILSEVTQQLPSSYNTISVSLVELVGQHLVNDIMKSHKQVQINKYNERLNRLTTIAQELNYLRQIRENIYTALSNITADMYTVKSVQNNNLPNLRIVSNTNPDIVTESSQKVFPKRKVLVILSFISTFTIIGFLVFFSEIITDKLYVCWQLNPKYPVPFAEIPFYPSLNKLQKNTDTIRRYLRGIFGLEPESNFFKVGSLSPKTGHEAIALSLATYVRRFKNSVVVCDCDTSSGHLSQQLHLTNAPGIKNVLRGEIYATEDLIQQNPELQIGVIPVGTGTIQHCGKKEIERFKKLLQYLEQHDIKTVLLETPVATDELLLTEACNDGQSLFVIKSGSVSVEQIETIQNQSFLQHGDHSTINAIILTSTPYMADILTLKGITEFIIYFVKRPFQLVLLRMRGHAN